MKVFIILFLLVRIGNILAIFKMSSYILFLVKLKGRGRSFLKGARRGTTLWDYPQEHLVVIRDEKISPFAKFEIRLSLFCFLLDPLTNKHWWTWTSMINLWIDCSTCQKQKLLLSGRQRSSNYWKPSKEITLREYDVVTLTMFYWKVLHDMVSQNSWINFLEAPIMS